MNSPVQRLEFRRPASYPHVLEAPHAAGNGRFRRQALDAGGAEETDDTLGVSENELRVLRLRDRSAVAQDEDVHLDLLGGVAQALDTLGRLLQCQRRFGAD